jgi:hypothetical protein
LRVNELMKQNMKDLILIAILISLSACEATNNGFQARQAGTSVGGVTFSGTAEAGIVR